MGPGLSRLRLKRRLDALSARMTLSWMDSQRMCRVLSGYAYLSRTCGRAGQISREIAQRKSNCLELTVVEGTPRGAES